MFVAHLLHERVEIVDSVIFSELTMYFEARMETIFKQLNLLGFPVKSWHRCRERFWRPVFPKTFIDLKICRIVVVCQLLKGQQNLVCFDCCKGVLIAEFWLTGKVVPFCFPEDAMREQYVTS